MRTPSLLANVAAHGISAVLLLVPAAVLGLAALRYGSGLLAAGAAVALLGGLLYVRQREAWRPPVSGSVILLYLVALGWLWVFTRADPDTFTRLARGGFLLVAVGLLVRHDLTRTGLGPRRHCLSRRVLVPHPLAGRRRGYDRLPEVRALRRRRPGRPRPGVRPAGRPPARKSGRPRSPRYRRDGSTGGRRSREALLAAAQRTTEPAVRAAAVAAIGSASDADHPGRAGRVPPRPVARRSGRPRPKPPLDGTGGRRWAVRPGRRPGGPGRPEPGCRRAAVRGGRHGCRRWPSCDLTTWAGRGRAARRPGHPHPHRPLRPRLLDAERPRHSGSSWPAR